MWPLADGRNDVNRRDDGIASGTIPTLSPGVCKVHAHAVFFPQKVDARNAFGLAHDLGCCRAVPSARHLPPLGPFLELWFNYKRGRDGQGIYSCGNQTQHWSTNTRVFPERWQKQAHVRSVK